MKLPTLYKKDNIGNIREWTIETFDGLPAYYEVTHGVVGGSLQTTQVEFYEGKNIGKSNETDAFEQCCSEAKSLWNKQIDRKGYSETNDGISKIKLVPPMLAKMWNEPSDMRKLKDGKHIKFPAYCSPKLDGCVSGDTLIKTKEYGYKPIKWIVENKIKCHVVSIRNGKLEYKPIVSYFKNKEESELIQWYEIELESGEKLQLTGNHPVYLSDLKCWRRVDELLGNENLMII